MTLEYRIEIEPAEDSQAARDILAEILRFNAERVGPLNDQRLVLVARDQSTKLIGGLVGGSFWNGLFVDLLWVAESFRNRGVGRSLMQRAEAEASARGCAVVFLSTFSFQAPRFYEALGYRPFGTLANMPAGFSRTWYAKWLTE